MHYIEFRNLKIFFMKIEKIKEIKKNISTSLSFKFDLLS